MEAREGCAERWGYAGKVERSSEAWGLRRSWALASALAWLSGGGLWSSTSEVNGKLEEVRGGD